MKEIFLALLMALFIGFSIGCSIGISRVDAQYRHIMDTCKWNDQENAH